MSDIFSQTKRSDIMSKISAEFNLQMQQNSD